MRAVAIAVTVIATCLTPALAPTAASASTPPQASSIDTAPILPTSAVGTGVVAGGTADAGPPPEIDDGASAEPVGAPAPTATPEPGMSGPSETVGSAPAPDAGGGAGAPPTDAAPGSSSPADAGPGPATAPTPTPAPTPATPTTASAPTPGPDPSAPVPTVPPTPSIPATPLPASTWEATARPAPGQVLVQTDPAGVDYGVDVSWTPPASVAPLGYRVELFSGRSASNSNALIARAEVDAATTRLRVEGVGFGTTTVIARVTLLDGAAAAPNPLLSDPATLPAASAGALGTSRAGVPTLSAPTADSVTVTWEAAPAAAGGDPVPAGYVVRVLERRHDQASASATSFIVGSFDVGSSTSAVISGLQGSSRYLAAVVAYDLVDGTMRFRGSSAPSAVPVWSTEYPAQTPGARTPATEWSNPPAAPVADSARSVIWQGTPTSGRFTGGSFVTGYHVQLFQAGAGLVATTEIPADPTADPATAAPPSTRFTGLAAGGTYAVRVAAINALGVGELSDFSPTARTPAGSTPGARPPAYADRAALQAALDAHLVIDATIALGGPITIQQGQDATVPVPWTGAHSGEAWWYGEGTFAATVATAATAPALPTTVPTAGLPAGEHFLLFISDAELDGSPAPAGAPTSVLRVVVVPGAPGPRLLDDAVLRWGLNDESNNGAYFGGCNYFSAGRTPDPGRSAVFTEQQYSAQAGAVTIEKPDASGRYERATWQTKCLDRTGAPLSAGSATPYGGNQFVITGGTGEVDAASGSASIRWTGDVTIVSYGGLAFWYLSDPVLTVEAGAGTLTATVGGFGADMNDSSRWVALPDRVVTLATFGTAQIGSDGFSVTPDYRGVVAALPAGQAPQSRSGADWGAFPQSLLDFHLESGQAAYWYSSGGQADAAKPAQPFVVGYDAASFVSPAAPQDNAEKASARVPTGTPPPPRRPAPAALNALPLALAAVATDAPGSSVVIVESPTSAALTDEVVLLLVALIALLGLVVMIAGVGGGLVVLGATTPAWAAAWSCSARRRPTDRALPSTKLIR